MERHLYPTGSLGYGEDLNGNGRRDFDDIVLLFENLDTPIIEDVAPLFDLNQSGGVDFDDVFLLFEQLVVE